MTTMETFKTALAERLKDKEYNGYSWMTTVIIEIRALLNELGFDGENIFDHQYGRGNYFSIKYRKDNAEATLVGIEVKKKRGAWNKGYFYNTGSYSWSFGEITFSTECKTLDELWDNMLVQLVKNKVYVDTKERRGIDIIKYIRTQFGLGSWDANSFIEYLNSHRYTLADKADAELKTEGVKND